MLKVMYAISVKGPSKTDLRTLLHPNQGRNHFDDKGKADEALDALKANERSIEVLESIGFVASEMRIDAIFCYDHGDALGIYVDDDPVMDAFTMRHLVNWINNNYESRSSNEDERPSQAGLLHRIVNHVQKNAVPMKDLHWPTLRDRVLDEA